MIDDPIIAEPLHISKSDPGNLFHIGQPNSQLFVWMRDHVTKLLVALHLFLKEPVFQSIIGTSLFIHM